MIRFHCMPTTWIDAWRVAAWSWSRRVLARKFWKLIRRQSPTSMRRTIGRGRLSERSRTLPGERTVPLIGTTSRRRAYIMP
ncbi:MAG: hypothetical protein DMF53_13635 [Acidobacteria bacterium]|nr:MAG: hypothetical protein DMF53_13635 [Acidobacteriota bacterium]